METELADIDHQITSSYGCQKRLAFYFLARLGTLGGLELYNLMRNDIWIFTDMSGREYVLPLSDVGSARCS